MTSPDHRLRLQQQLTELVTVERPRLLAAITVVDGKDPADQAERAVRELDLAQLDLRVQRLEDRLLAQEPPAAVPGRPDRLVRGTLLVLDFGDGPETYHYDDLDIDEELSVVTPSSPLGRALADAPVGRPVTYRTPRGEASVTLVSVGMPVAAA